MKFTLNLIRGLNSSASPASDNYATSLKTKFSGGDAPDIFSIQGYSDALVWQSQLADLTGEPFTSEMIDYFSRKCYA